MGLPLNHPDVLGQTLGRPWAAAAPTSALLAPKSSIASTATVSAASLVGLPADRVSGAQFGAQSGNRLGAGLTRLWSEARGALQAFIHAAQEARMRQALRHIAEIRSRLAPEGAEHELRKRAHFARYY